MSAEVKHTPGKLSADGTSLFFSDGLGGFDIRNCPAPEANAARLALCWNTHDQLVGALKSLLFYADGIHRADAHLEDETVDYETFPDARAALAAATGGASHG